MTCEQTFEALDRQALASGQSVYPYYFTYTSPYSPYAAHSAEVNFVFGNLGPNSMFGPTSPPSAVGRELFKEAQALLDQLRQERQS